MPNGTPTGTRTPATPGNGSSCSNRTPVGRVTSIRTPSSNSGSTASNQIHLLLESNKRIEEALKEIKANADNCTPAKHRERVPKELSVC